MILRIIGVGQFISKSSRIYPFKVFLRSNIVGKTLILAAINFRLDQRHKARQRRPPQYTSEGLPLILRMIVAPVIPNISLRCAAF